MKSQDSLSRQIATQLKKQRQAKGWSLDKLARASGVSKAMLGQIERQESSPTIATLWKIATGIESSFSSFIAGEAEGENTTSGSHGSDISAFANDPHMHVKTLFPFTPSTGFEVFEITLLNHHEQLSSAHRAGVLEHIHVLEGKLEIKQGEEWILLAQEQSFVLNAAMEHGYKARSKNVRFMDIIYYPK
ncbi:XRE family transcriptional regulator [Alteromonas pelagimontana]|uniref:XRE family transcriptional regulator n=1 Tax=Alteromonas pelagimontana TaxID=1858656 RepID=A0A6M4MCC1_9ALTE|nr:XRE family transcriptional regulator [Alteromonas pelagimontana]QJR80300.1 XRE family transcriptional regulator [Alteromonas pelagimontana]